MDMDMDLAAWMSNSKNCYKIITSIHSNILHYTFAFKGISIKVNQDGNLKETFIKFYLYRALNSRYYDIQNVKFWYCLGWSFAREGRNLIFFRMASSPLLSPTCSDVNAMYLNDSFLFFNFRDYNTNSFCKNKIRNYDNNVMQKKLKTKNLFLDCFSVRILINSLFFWKITESCFSFEKPVEDLKIILYFAQ